MPDQISPVNCQNCTDGEHICLGCGRRLCQEHYEKDGSPWFARSGEWKGWCNSIKCRVITEIFHPHRSHYLSGLTYEQQGWASQEPSLNEGRTLPGGTTWHQAPLVPGTGQPYHPGPINPATGRPFPRGPLGPDGKPFRKG